MRAAHRLAQVEVASILVPQAHESRRVDGIPKLSVGHKGATHKRMLIASVVANTNNTISLIGSLRTNRTERETTRRDCQTFATQSIAPIVKSVLSVLTG